MSCIHAFNQMCRKIVCPTRHDLNQDQMIQRKFRSNRVEYKHISIKNKNNKQLSTIIFQKDFIKYSTILYLHGNGGHKLQSLQITSQNVNLIAFDFAGCGKSQGEHITYGDNQVQDIADVIIYLKEMFNIKKIILWGRSMGASLAILYTSKYPRSIVSLVLDTPFRSLKKVVRNVAQYNGRSVPSFLISFAVYLIDKKTQSLVGTNIFKHDFSISLQSINIPIMFAYSTKDSVVKQQDVRQLYDMYKGEKSIFKLQSLHHQDRPKKFIESAYQFIIQSSKAFQKSIHSLKDSKFSYSKRVFILTESVDY